MAKVKTILHILVRGLIVVGGPKSTLALLFIIILNMDFYTSKVDAHKIPRITCLTTFFLGGTKESFQTFRWVLK
jgi:hypothetical protein